MKKLLKSYELNTDYEYYEMICMSVINGQRTQAVEQFKEMPRDNRKGFIKYLMFCDVRPDLSPSDKCMFINEL